MHQDPRTSERATGVPFFGDFVNKTLPPVQVRKGFAPRLNVTHCTGEAKVWSPGLVKMR